MTGYLANRSFGFYLRGMQHETRFFIVSRLEEDREETIRQYKENSAKDREVVYTLTGCSIFVITTLPAGN